FMWLRGAFSIGKFYIAKLQVRNFLANEFAFFKVDKEYLLNPLQTFISIYITRDVYIVGCFLHFAINLKGKMIRQQSCYSVNQLNEFSNGAVYRPPEKPIRSCGTRAAGFKAFACEREGEQILEIEIVEEV
ncbi:hypothetical protein ACJX0J_042125, partial [Zea mays]